MPPPESMPLCQLPQHKDGKVTKSKPKTAHKVERPEEAPLLPLELSLPFTHFPAEIQQMIWGEVIKGPSCHHFRIHKGVDADCDRWIIHILEKATQYDTSAYRQWKTLFQVRDRAFLAAFSHYTSRSQIQPIAVRMPANKRHVYTASAAIDIPKDLVILDFERGIQHPGFTWFEHMSPYPRSPMDFTCIQKRLVHFRKVAIHYKHHFKNACKNGPFSCYCPSIGTGIFNCSHYKACPRELACFLDCFTNLEAFYFVVEPRTKAHHRFTADFKNKISKNGYKGTRSVKRGEKIITEDVDLARFFDMETEFLEHPSPNMLTRLDMDSETPFSNPRECMIATMKVYKNRIGHEPFHNSLATRNQVKFGLLISYERDPNYL